MFLFLDIVLIHILTRNTVENEIYMTYAVKIIQGDPYKIILYCKCKIIKVRVIEFYVTTQRKIQLLALLSLYNLYLSVPSTTILKTYCVIEYFAIGLVVKVFVSLKSSQNSQPRGLAL